MTDGKVSWMNGDFNGQWSWSGNNLLIKYSGHEYMYEKFLEAQAWSLAKKDNIDIEHDWHTRHHCLLIPADCPPDGGTLTQMFFPSQSSQMRD
jgi:hypothetical protein